MSSRKALPHLDGDWRFLSKGKCRRKQNRQWTAHKGVARIKILLWHFQSRSGPQKTAISPNGSELKPGVWSSSALRGRTCRRSGSPASPGRIRARYGRGTRIGNPLAACTAPSVADGDNPTNWHNSAGFRTERANSFCHSAETGWASKISP